MLIHGTLSVSCWPPPVLVSSFTAPAFSRVSSGMILLTFSLVIHVVREHRCLA
ncbi:hypothetical protein BV20DRAFT_967785 [Pilatotrama ljubarskyi]|nr:hypothetical protein BV20DRAFT_967785 [Pilatotrama ljubarskyi]